MLTLPFLVQCSSAYANWVKGFMVRPWLSLFIDFGLTGSFTSVLEFNITLSSTYTFGSGFQKQTNKQQNSLQGSKMSWWLKYSLHKTKGIFMLQAFNQEIKSMRIEQCRSQVPSWGRMEWSGEGWSELGRDGVSWGGMEWARRDGVSWGGMEWARRDGMSWGGMRWGGNCWREKVKGSSTCSCLLRPLTV